MVALSLPRVAACAAPCRPYRMLPLARLVTYLFSSSRYNSPADKSKGVHVQLAAGCLEVAYHGGRPGAVHDPDTPEAF